MEYITKVKIDGSILIESEPSTALPYISNVVVQEATSINKGIDIGGTASNKLTFELYNSPLNGFDGLKVELYAREKTEAETGILSLVGTHTDEDILEDITKSDVYEADTPPEEPTASEAESDTIMSSFGYTSGTISGIASDPDSVTYSASETTASASGSFDGEMPTRDAGTYASATMTAGASDEDDFQMVGTFYITSAKDMGAFVSVTALDGFILMGDTFTPTTKTTTLYALYEDFRAKLLAKGIEVEEEAFDDETVVTWTPSASFRESAGIFAGMLGGYANFNRSGVLAIRQYALGGYDIAYSSLIGIDESGDTVQIYSVMNGSAKSYSIYPTDAEVDDGTLQFSNSMVTSEQLEEIGSMYIGVEYQPATVQTDFFLNIEAGDFINVDVYDHNITICNTNQTINFDEGVTTITSLGDSSTIQIQKLLSGSDSVSEASKTATKYITEMDNGIFVHPEGDEASGVHIDGDSVDLMVGNKTVGTFNSSGYREAQITSTDSYFPIFTLPDITNVRSVISLKDNDGNGVPFVVKADGTVEASPIGQDFPSESKPWTIKYMEKGYPHMLDVIGDIRFGGLFSNSYINMGVFQFGPVLMQWGRKTLTPSGSSTVKTASETITFDREYASAPAVLATPGTTATTTTIRGTASSITAKSFSLNLQRSNTTATSVEWFAIGLAKDFSNI